LPIAKLLIDKGADFYANKDGKSPQTLAAEHKGKGEAMKRYLEQTKSPTLCSSSKIWTSRSLSKD